MMGRLPKVFHHLPLKVKLLLAAAALITGLFLVYNFAQYLVLQQWMLKLEKSSIQEMMAELQDHFSNGVLSNDPDLLDRHKRFIESINQNNQLVRVLDAKGQLLLSVTDGVPEDLVPPATAGRTQLIQSSLGSHRLLILRSPLETPSFKGTIEIINSLETYGRLHEMMLIVTLAGGLLAIVIGGWGGWLIARQLLRPVQSLAVTMARAKENGLQERVTITDNGDELSQLAGLFNGLMEQVEASFRQQKQFVEDASHELRTPISIMEGHLMLLDRWGKDDPVILEESLRTSLQQLGRLKGIMQELLDLTRAEAGVPLQSVNPLLVLTVFRDTLDGFAAVHSEFHYESDMERLDGVVVRIEQRHLEQILLILLDNAVRYSADRKHISMRGKYENGELRIQIRDRGIGIAETHLPHVFDRFYRADTARSRERGGTGLGLSIAKRLVGNYGGSIRLLSMMGEGTEVLVTFPAQTGWPV